MQVMFPSTQLGTGENWTLMKTISVTEYLNYQDGQLMFHRRTLKRRDTIMN